MSIISNLIAVQNERYVLANVLFVCVHRDRLNKLQAVPTIASMVVLFELMELSP